MLRHKGKARTYRHNLRLAALLSFIAGLVNVTGVLSIKTLTTNVTGHFAFFAEELAYKRYSSAFLFFMLILAFLTGAFAASFLSETVSRYRERFSHHVPLIIEAMILLSMGLFGGYLAVYSPFTIACLLLFAMGMQNSLVTKISSSTVRTTHLTGLFTDLGIELSQLFFYKQPNETKQLHKSIRLRLTIILFFFIGCVLGGYAYNYLGLLNLAIGSLLLFFASMYDLIRYRYYLFLRRSPART